MAKAATLNQINSPQDVADFFGVSRRTVQNMCRYGQLKAFRVGRQWRISRGAVLECAGLVQSHCDESTLQEVEDDD